MRIVLWVFAAALELHICVWLVLSKEEGMCFSCRFWSLSMEIWVRDGSLTHGSGCHSVLITCERKRAILSPTRERLPSGPGGTACDEALSAYCERALSHWSLHGTQLSYGNLNRLIWISYISLTVSTCCIYIYPCSHCLWSHVHWCLCRRFMGRLLTDIKQLLLVLRVISSSPKTSGE